MINKSGSSNRLDEDLRIVELVSQLEWHYYKMSVQEVSEEGGFDLVGYRAKEGNERQLYLLHLPRTNTGRRLLPLVVVIASHPDRHPFLQAAPTTGTEELRRFAFQGDRFGYAVLIPLLEGEHDAPMATEEILTAIHQVEAHFSIDRKRIYLTGDCRDGRDAILLAERVPGLFAAVSTARALTGMVTKKIGDDVYDCANPLLFIQNLGALPIRLIHGRYFPHSPTIQATTFMNQARREGKSVDLILLPRDGELADQDMSELELEFFYGKFLSTSPTTISYSTCSPEYNESFWIRVIQRYDNARMATVRAKWDNGDEIVIETSNIRRMELLPDRFPLAYQMARSIYIRLNGQRRVISRTGTEPIVLMIKKLTSS